MPVLTSTDLKIFVAKQIRESLSEALFSNVYISIGKVSPWTDDNNPVNPGSTDFDFRQTWDNMIGGKRLTTNDVQHVIPRFDWTANTVYVAYDDKLSNEFFFNGNTQFYTVTDEFNVYKCIANNYGSNSTVKPTSTSTTNDFQTLDGYVWKYMYTIPDEDRLRFTNDGFIPVKTLSVNNGSLQWQVQDNALDGAIHNIVLTNNGSGYTANDVYISITGDGTGANAYAVLNTTSNTVSSIIVDNKGTDYSNASVEIYSSLGSGAKGRAIISPAGGHGSNSLNELGGRFLLVNGRLKNSEGNIIIINNDYRQVCLIEDPKDYLTQNSVTLTAFTQLMTLTVNGVSSEYIEDEYVYQGNTFETATFKGIVSQWDSANSIIRLSNIFGTPTTELLTGQLSAASRFVSSIQNPDLKPYSGKILYTDNIVPIERAEDQTEDFKIVLKF